MFPSCSHTPAGYLQIGRCSKGCHDNIIDGLSNLSAPSWAGTTTSNSSTPAPTKTENESDKFVTIAALDEIPDEPCSCCQRQVASVSVVFLKSNVTLGFCNWCASLFGTKMTFLMHGVEGVLDSNEKMQLARTVFDSRHV